MNKNIIYISIGLIFSVFLYFGINQNSLYKNTYALGHKNKITPKAKSNIYSIIEDEKILNNSQNNKNLNIVYPSQKTDERTNGISTTTFTTSSNVCVICPRTRDCECLWASNGIHIYNLNQGNVGIGIRNPQSKLHVLGNTNLSSIESPILFSTSSSIISSRWSKISSSVFSSIIGGSNNYIGSGLFNYILGGNNSIILTEGSNELTLNGAYNLILGSAYGRVDLNTSTPNPNLVNNGLRNIIIGGNSPKILNGSWNILIGGNYSEIIDSYNNLMISSDQSKILNTYLRDDAGAGGAGFNNTMIGSYNSQIVTGRNNFILGLGRNIISNSSENFIINSENIRILPFSTPTDFGSNLFSNRRITVINSHGAEIKNSYNSTLIGGSIGKMRGANYSIVLALASTSYDIERSNILAILGGDVGIDTPNPKAKLHVDNGDIFISQPGRGIILKSPDGNRCSILTLDNNGNLNLRRFYNGSDCR
jgi:hypothetical protein